MLRVLILIVALLVVACARPAERPIGPGAQTPVLAADHIIAADGYYLPLHRWLPGDDPRAVVLALHGFNDYGGAFDVLADGFKAQGVALYAYDQRGFGATEPRGIWAGEQRLVDDAMVAARLLQERYPEQPLFLVGKSMGGAVTMLALTHEDAPTVGGSILIAPAVWGEEVMPWYQQFGLWLGETITPGMRLSADLAQGLGIAPTDDEAVLEELREDPMVQREARIDTIEGLSDLMDSALQASQALPGPTLILYGDQDEIIPAEPICLMLRRLPDRQTRPWRMVLYPGGYHMLTRYTEAEQVHEDINAWLADVDGELPSGHEVDRQGARDVLCH
ncbi:alpha/beta fold hydrolase [Aquisalimonas sp.]|uniref:alpha/beta fold hydrolase n=1 Tax=Aquisalimonas sp. TaxID=1872621 RepID=UPI0025C1BCE9|nr:alpha/beta fold hydrolase [Aquisalimonas sp.]